MKVLNVCETAAGGIGTYLKVIASAPEDRLQMWFLVPEHEIHLMDNSAGVVAYPASKRGLPALLQMLRGMRRMIAEIKPDAVFFHSTFSLLGLTAYRMMASRAPSLYCAHGWAVCRYPPKSIRARLVAAVEGRLAAIADRVVNISKYDARLAASLGYRGAHVTIENAVGDRSPVRRDDIFGREAGAIHLLFVGRFDRQKGLDLLLRAFDRARVKNPLLRLHIVGASVRQKGRNIELPPGVTITDWIDNSQIDSWYSSADAVVVPSRWESFGLVIPEALRNGTPVLTSRSGALPDLVTPEIGRTFDLRGHDLEQCLATLDQSELSRLSQNCRPAYLARFTRARLRADLEKVFTDITTSHSTSPASERSNDQPA